MKRLKAIVFAAAMGLLAAPAAHAAVLTFDHVIAPTSQFTSFSYNGFDFTTLPGPFAYIWNAGSPNSNNTNNLIYGYAGANTLNITKTGGGLFDFNSIAMAISWYDSNAAENIFVNGTLLTLSQTLTTYNLNLLGVSNVAITGFNSGYWLADNITVNSVSSVPLPAALPLLLTALGGATALSRRRKRRAA